MAVFLELAKFASLLLSILSLDALFHAAFLEPASHFEQRLLPSLDMLVLSAAVCLGGGYIFHAWEQKAGRRDASIVRSLPMLIFWWGAGIITLLFAMAWLLQTYFFGWRRH
jgi:hypothetical protein